MDKSSLDLARVDRAARAEGWKERLWAVGYLIIVAIAMFGWLFFLGRISFLLILWVLS